MFSNFKHIAKGTLVTCLVAVPLVFSMAGCASNKEKIAATVNGTEITEQKITDYVQNYRVSNQLEDDKAWAQWIVNNGYDVKKLREDSINLYVKQTVIEQDAKKHDVTVSNEAVQEQIANVREYYGYDDAEWEQQLQDVGYNVDSYNEYVYQSLLQEALMDKITSSDVTDDAAVLKVANDYADSINGSKELKTIALDLSATDKANDIVAKLKSGELDFETAQKESTTDYYNGWDCLVSVDAAVADVVTGLEKGTVSDPIVGASNIFIVKVNDTLTIPEGGFTNKDQLPTALYDEFKASAESTSKYNEFETYVKDLIDSATVVINEKPEGLPYDVSLEGVVEDITDETPNGQLLENTNQEGNTASDNTNQEGNVESNNTATENTEISTETK